MAAEVERDGAGHLGAPAANSASVNSKPAGSVTRTRCVAPVFGFRIGGGRALDPSPGMTETRCAPRRRSRGRWPRSGGEQGRDRGREHLPDERPGLGVAALADGFERRALGGVGALVHDHLERAVRRGGWARATSRGCPSAGRRAARRRSGRDRCTKVCARQWPCVGSELNWHGHPQSQLQLTNSTPSISHSVNAIGAVSIRQGAGRNYSTAAGGPARSRRASLTPNPDRSVSSAEPGDQLPAGGPQRARRASLARRSCARGPPSSRSAGAPPRRATRRRTASWPWDPGSPPQLGAPPVAGVGDFDLEGTFADDFFEAVNGQCRVLV